MDKKLCYEDMHAQLRALLVDEHDLIANLANASALLNMHLTNINWVGFYLYKDKELMLGPFQGKPACMHIPMGKGVCGTSANNGICLRIDDVYQFPGHIACDASSRSEIVIPFYRGQELLGVLDIDAPILARFDQADEDGLQTCIHIIEQTLG